MGGQRPPVAGAKRTPTVSARVGSTRVGFVWDPTLASYVRTGDNGRILTNSSAPVAKPNVLVQLCQVIPDRTDHDVKHQPHGVRQVCGLGAGRAVPYQQADRGHLVPTGPQHPDNVHRRCREASAVRSGWDVRGPGTPRRPCLIRHSAKPDAVPDQMLWLTTYSMLSMSFETSSGSIAGNIPTRSWLRPSLR